MSLTIKIRVNKTSNNSPVIYDVSNDVIINSVEIQERADFSFECGSFKIVTSQIDYNIPPYSIVKIIDDSVTKYYCVSSECNSYLTTGKWVHDCTLLALESILECYILGAKTWSLNNVGSDYKVCQFTTNLLKLNDSGFAFDNSNSYSLLVNAHNEYTFPDGTTYYEAFKQIANKNEIRLKLSVVNFDTTSMFYRISLMGENQANYTLSNSDGALSFKMLQNVDDYCKYLLTCGSDVVDRGFKTTFKNLTVRASNGVVVDADHTELILPTRVEGITKLVINGYIGIGNMKIKSNGWDENYVDANIDDYDSTSKWTVAKTLYQWRTLSPLTGWQAVYDLWLKDLGLDNAYFKVVYYRSGSSSIWAGQTFAVICDEDGDEYYSVDGSQKYHWYSNLDMTDYLLEKNEFEAKDVSFQPNYLVYTSGGNSITNFNAQYKNDFWGAIMSITNHGMFNNNHSYSFSDSNGDYSISYIYSIGPGDSQSNPIDYTFDVECVPISNPILIDEKNDTPSNEDNYKPMTRTYSMGDNNGLVVDLKALTNDIDKQNETLGKIEAVLEADSSKLLYEEEDDGDTYDVEYIPTPNDGLIFEFKGKTYTFYVSSFVKRYTATKCTYQLNLTKTRFKIADAIGVDYQFNPTYLPLENIVERSLFFETTINNFGGYVNSGTFLIEIVFHNGSGTTYQRLCAMPVVMKTKGYWVLYCEAMDNIVFGMSTNDVSSTKKSINNISYGDSEANCSYISVYILQSSGSLSSSESYKLPLVPTSSMYATSVYENKLIYKDSREKLTFTIKVNDSSLI